MTTSRKPNPQTTTTQPFRQTMQRGALLALVAILCAACGGNSGTATPTAAPTTVPPTAAPAQEQPTVAPVVEPTPVPPKSVPGVNLTLDPALGKSVNAQLMPAVPKTEGPAFGDAAPEHVAITFDGEALSDSTLRQRMVRIYPVEGLRQIDPSISKIIDQLKQTLQRKPKAIRGAVPFLPTLNAQQVFYSNLAYVPFANGEGVRFITAYAQDVAPLTNNEIFYAFQGLTSDGKYLVSAIYPVAAEGLPLTFEETAAATNYEEFAKGYEKYLTETTAQLNKLTPQQFVPDLTKLDSMLTSLQADPQMAAGTDAAVADPNKATDAKATPKAGEVSADVKATPTVGADASAGNDDAAAGSGDAQLAVAVVRRLVNLREGPSTRTKVLDNLNRNSKVQMLGRDARVSWIRVKAADGKEGWVARSFLATRYNLRSLPIVR